MQIESTHEYCVFLYVLRAYKLVHFSLFISWKPVLCQANLQGPRWGTWDEYRARFIPPWRFHQKSRIYVFHVHILILFMKNILSSRSPSVWIFFPSNLPETRSSYNLKILIPHFAVCSGMQGVMLMGWFVFHTLLQGLYWYILKKLDLTVFCDLGLCGLHHFNCIYSIRY